MTLAQIALQIAVSQIGVEEVPRNTNRGPQIKKYLKSVGLGEGYPWCMAYVYWCVKTACEQLGIANPLVKTGGVLKQWNETTARKIPNRGNGIAPGDVFIMQYGEATGHTGFVVKVGNGVVHTIEGNTNDEGSREGYEVAYRVRSLSAIKGFIKL